MKVRHTNVNCDSLLIVNHVNGLKPANERLKEKVEVLSVDSATNKDE